MKLFVSDFVSTISAVHTKLIKVPVSKSCSRCKNLYMLTIVWLIFHFKEMFKAFLSKFYWNTGFPEII